MIGGRKMRHSKAEGGRRKMGVGGGSGKEAHSLSFCSNHAFPGFPLGCFQIAYGFPADY